MAESTKPRRWVNNDYARERRLIGRLADPGSIPGASTLFIGPPPKGGWAFSHLAPGSVDGANAKSIRAPRLHSTSVDVLDVS